MTSDDEPTIVEKFRFYAEHFSFRDWDYTRKHNIKRITYGPRKRRDGKVHRHPDHLWERIKKSVRYLVTRKLLGRRHRFRMARVALESNNLPDGILDGGSIITFWEETGEYLQFVQPTVGSMLCDWLQDEPDNPHAQRIVAELTRIDNRYTERLAKL